MTESEVIERVQTGRLWYCLNEDQRAVWGVGEIILPIELEWESL